MRACVRVRLSGVNGTTARRDGRRCTALTACATCACVHAYVLFQLIIIAVCVSVKNGKYVTFSVGYIGYVPFGQALKALIVD